MEGNKREGCERKETRGKYAKEGNKSEACERNETRGKEGRGRKQERRNVIGRKQEGNMCEEENKREV